MIDTYERTRNQLVAVILIDSINQCNQAQLPQEFYELKLKALLRERLGPTGNKELEI